MTAITSADSILRAGPLADAPRQLAAAFMRLGPDDGLHQLLAQPAERRGSGRDPTLQRWRCRPDISAHAGQVGVSYFIWVRVDQALWWTESEVNGRPPTECNWPGIA